MSCYQLIKIISKFEKETRHRLHVFIKKKKFIYIYIYIHIYINERIKDLYILSSATTALSTLYIYIYIYIYIGWRKDYIATSSDLTYVVSSKPCQSAQTRKTSEHVYIYIYIYIYLYIYIYRNIYI